MSVDSRDVFSVIGLLIRVLCVFFSHGYTHPDEFFQGPEIVSADFFSVHVQLPWEFDPTSPARSVLAPYSTSALPFAVLGVIDACLRQYAGLSVLNGLSLLYAPRIYLLIVLHLVEKQVPRTYFVRCAQAGRWRCGFYDHFQIPSKRSC